jgi:hypothetical protein
MSGKRGVKEEKIVEATSAATVGLMGGELRRFGHPTAPDPSIGGTEGGGATSPPYTQKIDPSTGVRNAEALRSAFTLQTFRILPANREKSGEGGIRTHETASNRLRDFQSRSFGQLGHLS